MGKAVEVSASLLGGARGRRASRLPLGAGLGSCSRALVAAAAASASFSSMGWEWARGREGLSAQHCKDDFVAASAGVGGGRESIVDKGPQGPLLWEAEGKGGEASLREGLHPFSGGLPVPAFRPVTVGAD